MPEPMTAGQLERYLRAGGIASRQDVRDLLGLLGIERKRADEAEAEVERLRNLCSSYASDYTEPEVVARLHAEIDRIHALYDQPAPEQEPTDA
jgi:hypothetical protein